MAKIAVELERALSRRAVSGAAGEAAPRRLAQGAGWTVDDVICTSGPRDRCFEEQHSMMRIVIVAAGSFEYRAQTRSGRARELMTPGALLLGHPGQYFECRHAHGAGDRCLSFGYTPEYFEQIAAGAGFRSPIAGFPTLRVPPLREFSLLIAEACRGLTGAADLPWEEISVKLAARTVATVSGLASDAGSQPPGAVARVTRAVRAIAQESGVGFTLTSLSEKAGLSPYHFLRTFERLTGATPHQYLLRVRLRNAALRLATERSKIVDLALDCGFGDVSNFNRAFRGEFGVSPRAYRQGRAATSAAWAGTSRSTS